MDPVVEIPRKPRRPKFDLEKELENENNYSYTSRDGNADLYSHSEYIDRRVPHHMYEPSSSSPYPAPVHTRFPDADAYNEDVTLGQYIINRVGDAVKGVFRSSQTILRVDLRQALLYDGPILQQKRGPGRPKRIVAANDKREPSRVLEGRYEDDEEVAVQSRGWFHGLQGGGARLKLMQIWEFKDPETGQDRLPWNLNFGFGANVVMDRGEAQPKLRIRAQYAAFHFFPEPYLELRGKWPLGNTNLAIRARYRLPLSSMSKFWETTSSQLMVNLYHRSGTGVHLTPGGVEFDDQTVPIGQYGTMRIAASLDFPRQFPLEEGEQPVRLRVTRLGLKSRIM